MKKGQASVRGGIQDLLCPFTDVYVTQGANGSYSHKGTMAVDVRGLQAGVRYPYYAPCDVKCVYTIPSYGQAHWQSINKVRCANKYVGYVSFVTVHDDSFDAKVGQVVKQGSQLGNMGTKGQATGVHCHIEFAQGKYDINNWKKNNYGIYFYPNEKDLDEMVFFDNTNVMNCPTLVKKYLKDVPVEEPIKKIGTPTKRDTNKNQIEVKADELRVRKGAGTNQTILGYANKGIYDYTEIKNSNNYDWYNIGIGFIAYNKDWCNVYLKEEPKVEEPVKPTETPQIPTKEDNNTNTPPNTETTENEPKKEETEHNEDTSYKNVVDTKDFDKEEKLNFFKKILELIKKILNIFKK